MSGWTKPDEVGAEAAATLEAEQALVSRRGFHLSPEHKPLKVQGGMLLAAQAAFILMNALGITLTVLAASFVERALAGTFASEEAFQNEAIFLESAADGLFWASIAVLVVCIVTYSLFVYAAARNIERSNATGLEDSAKWAVGWSFVPLANLFKPFAVMGQIWKTSHDPVRAAIEKPAYMLVWWIPYVVGNIGSTITQRMAAATEDPEQIITLSWVEAGASTLSIIAGFTLIIIVRQVINAQAKWSSISAPQAPSPPQA